MTTARKARWKTLDLALTVGAVLFALATATETYLADQDDATGQHLAQAQQYLRQHVPQARGELQTLALRVNQSVPRSPALKQILDNLRLTVNNGPAPAPQPSAPEGTPLSTPR